MKEEKTKSFPVSKRMVYDSYLKVMTKKGCAGIDGQSIKMFELSDKKIIMKYKDCCCYNLDAKNLILSYR